MAALPGGLVIHQMPNRSLNVSIFSASVLRNFHFGNTNCLYEFFLSVCIILSGLPVLPELSHRSYPFLWAAEDWTQCFLFQQAAVCRSTVRLSAEEVQDVWVRCRWSSSSESNSSEEVGPGVWCPPGQCLVGSVWVCDKQTSVIESRERHPGRGEYSSADSAGISPTCPTSSLSVLLCLYFPEIWKQLKATAGKSLTF